MKYFLRKHQRVQETKRGYILLLTLLVISILLAVGFGIADISKKEVVLSSFIRDSQKAFAAADRGVECALYWDRSTGPSLNGLPYTIFATGTMPTYYVYPNLAGVSCNGVNFSSTWTHTETATMGTTAFSLSFADGTCVDVTVVKTGDTSTSITGDGYNTCNVALPRRTQREIVVFTTF